VAISSERLWGRHGRLLPTDMPHSRLACGLALLGSLAIHGLLLLIWRVEVAYSARHTPDAVGGLAAQGGSGREDSAMTVLFVTALAPDGLLQSDAPMVAPPVLRPVAVSINAALIAPRVDADETPDPQSAQDGNTEGDNDSDTARTYGRYVQQVQARIEQAWLRPRMSIGDAAFRCRARIQQNRDGTIHEIMLEDCNGPSAWQRSLAGAIETASPLPVAPSALPEPEFITLIFTAYEYRPGESAEGFEPEPRPLQVSSQPPPSRNRQPFLRTRPLPAAPGTWSRCNAEAFAPRGGARADREYACQ
jgi:hypothetical protein